MNTFKIGKSKEDDSNVITVSNKIDSCINAIALEIFSSYKNELLSAQREFIFSAVWGFNRDKELTKSQNDIYNRINRVILTISEILGIDNLKKSQRVVIEYLVRNLIIMKLLFMIELLWNNLKTKEENNLEKYLLKKLIDIDVCGNA